MSNPFGSALQYARHYGFTVLICTAIATVLWTVGDDEFVTSWIFSLCIGLSIHTFTVIGIAAVSPGAIWRVWIVSVPLGVASGLVFGALLNGLPVSAVIAGSSPLMSLVISLVATYIFYSWYSMIEMRDLLRQQELSQVRSEKRLVETQLRLLQSQIEPHFLFNTLSHVVSLIDTDADRAGLMLRKLTQFLRVSLRRTRSENTTLQDELDLVADYLAILKIRMDARLEYEIVVDVAADQIPFPPLMLQPIVENAIIHGLEPLEEGGKVVVTVRAVNGQLMLKVSDNGVGLGEGKGGAGMGLHNVRERLRMLFGKEARVDFVDVSPQGLEVTLTIPEPGLQHE